MSTYAGARDPEALQVTLSSGAGVDLTTVVSAAGTLYRPDGSTASWPFTLGAETAMSLVITHVYAADGSDVPSAGGYKLAIVLTFPAAVTRRVTPITFTVRAYP